MGKTFFCLGGFILAILNLEINIPAYSGRKLGTAAKNQRNFSFPKTQPWWWCFYNFSMAILNLEINIPAHSGRKLGTAAENQKNFSFFQNSNMVVVFFTILVPHFTEGLWPGHLSKFKCKISFWQVMGIPIAPTGQISLFIFHFENKIDESGGKFQIYFKRVRN